MNRRYPSSKLSFGLFYGLKKLQANFVRDMRVSEEPSVDFPVSQIRRFIFRLTTDMHTYYLQNHACLEEAN